MRVHQLLSGAGPFDAVTNQARAYRTCFDDWGWGGSDHAVYVDPRAGERFRPLAALRPEDDDVLLFHYSAYAPRLVDELDRPHRKLLVSHNITPARWLWGYEAMIAVQCTIGREQLPRFAQAVDLAAGVSEFNARELAVAGARETTVIPILFSPERFGSPETPPASAPPFAAPPRSAPAAGGPVVLFVGRIAPHKRHDLLLRAFALYRREHAPQARLVLVGEAMTPAFGAAVRELADRVVPGAVEFAPNLTDAALAQRWGEASAFLCLSEHEGFCIPLLEAFHFGVPVVARAVGGISEVAGDAALLLDAPEGTDVDLALAAQLMHLAVSDADLAGELRRRGRARLVAYAFDQTAQRLRAAVERVAAA